MCKHLRDRKKGINIEAVCQSISEENITMFSFDRKNTMHVHLQALNIIILYTPLLFI